MAGVAHKSYGIAVAKQAGLPQTLIDQADQLSRHFEDQLKEAQELSYKQKQSTLGAADAKSSLTSAVSIDAPRADRLAAFTEHEIQTDETVLVTCKKEIKHETKQ